MFALLKPAKLFEYGKNWFVWQDFDFCQDFVSMQGRTRIYMLRSKLIALKKFYLFYYEKCPSEHNAMCPSKHQAGIEKISAVFT